MRSRHDFYYACVSLAGAPATRISGMIRNFVTRRSVSKWRDQVRNTHQSHDFRVSTNEDYRLRGLVGAF